MRVCIQLARSQMSCKRDPCVKKNDNNYIKPCVYMCACLCIYVYIREGTSFSNEFELLYYMSHVHKMYVYETSCSYGTEEVNGLTKTRLLIYR